MCGSCVGANLPHFQSRFCFHFQVNHSFFFRFPLQKIGGSENVGVWEHFRQFPIGGNLFYSQSLKTFLSLYIHVFYAPTLPHSNTLIFRVWFRVVFNDIQQLFKLSFRFYVGDLWEHPHKCGIKVGAYPPHRCHRSRSAGAKCTAVWFLRCVWSWCIPCLCRV